VDASRHTLSTEITNITKITKILDAISKLDWLTVDCVGCLWLHGVGHALYLLDVVVVVEELAFAEALNPVGVIAFYHVYL
jgi:hypothetical protein